MGDPQLGRYASVKISSTLIENLGRWTLNRTGGDIDVSVFGDTWEKRMPGMKGWNASIEGFADPADTTGQDVLVAAWEDGTKLDDIRFYIDADSYYSPAVEEDADSGCYIQNITTVQDKAGVATITINILGFGKIREYGPES